MKVNQSFTWTFRSGNVFEVSVESAVDWLCEGIQVTSIEFLIAAVAGHI